MDKSVVIIPNETITSIRPFKRNCEHHPEALTKFAFLNDISIMPSTLKDSFETSYQLAEQGFCVLLYDNEETLKNVMIFLPLQISEKQYEFFKSKKEEFNEYNVNVLSQEEIEKFNLYDKTTHPEYIYEHLLSILEEKLILSSKSKTKKLIKEEN